MSALTPQEAIDQLLTVADVAGIVGCDEKTMRHWILRGELKAAKFNTRIGWRIKRSDFAAFYQQCTLTGAISGELLATSATDRLT